MIITFMTNGSIALERGEPLYQGSDGVNKVIVNWAEGQTPVGDIAVDIDIMRPDGQATGFMAISPNLQAENLEYNYSLEAWDLAVDGEGSIHIRWRYKNTETTQGTAKVKIYINKGRISNFANFNADATFFNRLTAAENNASNAYDVAVYARSSAEIAYGVASEAKQTANDAKNVASSAATTANGLAGNIAQANQTANEAKNVASSAEQNSITAKNVASSAATTANGLAGSIAQANQTANEANQTAEEANQAAEEAKDSANEAKDISVEAKTIAEEARNAVIGQIPLASETTIGGVKAKPKTPNQTESVGIDENGDLWVREGGGDLDLISEPLILPLLSEWIKQSYEVGRYDYMYEFNPRLGIRGRDEVEIRFFPSNSFHFRQEYIFKLKVEEEPWANLYLYDVTVLNLLALVNLSKTPITSEVTIDDRFIHITFEFLQIAEEAMKTYEELSPEQRAEIIEFLEEGMGFPPPNFNDLNEVCSFITFMYEMLLDPVIDILRVTRREA